MDEENHRDHCELTHGTHHLPESVRDIVYQQAYQRGHSAGMGEVLLEYGEADTLRRALEDALSISQTVNHYEGVKAACTRVGLTIDEHDEFTWSLPKERL